MGRLGTLDLLSMIAWFVKRNKIGSLKEAADLN
jgi:hypothetical protein